MNWVRQVSFVFVILSIIAQPPIKPAPLATILVEFVRDQAPHNADTAMHLPKEH